MPWRDSSRADGRLVWQTGDCEIELYPTEEAG